MWRRKKNIPAHTQILILYCMLIMSSEYILNLSFDRVITTIKWSDEMSRILQKSKQKQTPNSNMGLNCIRNRKCGDVNEICLFFWCINKIYNVQIKWVGPLYEKQLNCKSVCQNVSFAISLARKYHPMIDNVAKCLQYESSNFEWRAFDMRAIET